MLVGKGGYAILDLKHVGNSGTVSGIFEYAKKLCETGKQFVVVNPYTTNKSYPAETGSYNVNDNTVRVNFYMSNVLKELVISSNDSIVLTSSPNIINFIPNKPQVNDTLVYLGNGLWTNGTGGRGIDFEVLDSLVWTWDSTFKSWTAPLDSEVAEALESTDHEVYVQLELPMDNGETPETIYLGCLLFNGGGSNVSSSWYAGSGTPFITAGEYIFKVSVITDPDNPTLQVEPFTLSKPS